MRSGRARRGKEKETHVSETGPEIEHAEKASKERCPQCKDDADDGAAAVKEDWVRCDACKVWFHWRCVGDGGDLEVLDKWFCKPCQTADPKRTITLKPPARKSSRKKPARDYASLHNGVPAAGPDKWHALLQAKDAAGAFARDPFRHMNGSELSLDWVDSDPSALLEPVLVETPDGLGMSMPPADLTVADVARIVGEDTPVEVMDVATQSNTPGYTLAKWAAYIGTPSDARDRIRNVISLEISDTPLGAQIVPPRLVRELDWVERFWPAGKKGHGHAYPKVQLYCLMGVAKAWTDWHIDFAGSSVYYHILSGAKTFYFIRPTPANLAAYERWSGSELQTSTWLGDLADTVFKVELTQGNTMVIPTGWIHAVYTPVDTLVFGGNFLHSYNIATQLRVREIENTTRVPKKFQFPYFTKLCWYAAEASLRALKAREDFSPRVLASFSALARFLVSEARIMESVDEGKSNKHNGSVSATRRREAKDSVPGDRVKDAPSLARELRWRVRVATHGSSDAEDEYEDAHGRTVVKRKRGASSVAAGKDAEDAEAEVRFRNFVPKKWDAYQVRAVAQGRVRRRVPAGCRPPFEKKEEDQDAGAEWTGHWMEWNEDRGSDSKENGDAKTKMDVDTDPPKDEEAVKKGGNEAEVERKHEVMLRVRRTARGLERQRVERTIELWEWVDS
ncbi:Clavaminate synthase-like protein [Phellopilus nigrolimitatus]|nr:Clavaminate synthase-like protein [Phellopilus nigrolimitatus]